MKDFYVVFGDNGARIVKGDKPAGECLKNPSLANVRGIAPHLWKLVNGEIVSSVSPISAPFLATKKPSKISSRYRLESALISLAVSSVVCALAKLIF